MNCLPFRWIYLFNFSGHVNIIRILIENGANVNATDDRMQAPIHKATLRGNHVLNLSHRQMNTTRNYSKAINLINFIPFRSLCNF